MWNSEETRRRSMSFSTWGQLLRSTGSLVKRWRSRWRKVSAVICDKDERKIYRRAVGPAGLFGLETLELTKRPEEELEEAELKILRFSL